MLLAQGEEDGGGGRVEAAHRAGGDGVGDDIGGINLLYYQLSQA